MIVQKIFNDRDVYQEGSFILMDGSRLVGIIVTKVNNRGMTQYKDCAWISTLIVAEHYRKTGCGDVLYTNVEESLKKIGIKKIIIGGEIDNFFSGIPQPTEQSIRFFTKRGYVINNEDHYDLIADVSTIDFDNMDNISMNHDEWYITKEMAIEDKGKLEEFFDKTFPGRWKHEIMEYIDNGQPLENILILWHKQEVVGFCKIHKSETESDFDGLYGSSWGSLGPIGISEHSRGKGVGNRILNDSLRKLKLRGTRNVIIDWTVLKDFYGQFGFKPWKIYRGAYKLLK